MAKLPARIAAALGLALTLGPTLAVPGSVQAATLGLRSSAATVAEGATFTVTLSVNTQGKAINNAEAIVTYPSDLLEAVSTSRGGSIFTLWIAEPSISTGSVTLNGGVPNPGYTGSGGSIASVTFRARRAGTATIGISGAAVRENDGLGTDILTGAGSVTVSITPASEQPEPAERPEQTQPEQVVADELSVWSTTHPSTGTWYRARTVAFGWSAPAGTRALQVALDESPSGAPSRALPAASTDRSYDDVGDGIWYFHIRAQTGQGWTRAATVQVRVDATPPSAPTVALATTSGGLLGLSLRAEDTASGIQYYEVRVDGGQPQSIPAELAKQPVTIPGLTPGQHRVSVAAFDNAGNRSEREEVLLVLPQVAPEFSYRVVRGLLGSRLLVSGQSEYPNGTVTISLRSPDGKVTSRDVRANADGRFSYRSQVLGRAGGYQVWAYETVAVSGPESPVTTVQVMSGGLGSLLRPPLVYLVLPLVAAAWFAISNLRRYLRLRRLRRQPADSPSRGRRRI